MSQPSTQSRAQTGVERREAWVAQQIARTGINEDMIRRLVDAFYAKVLLDPVLAPVFEARVRNWSEHLAKLHDFWSGVALMTGRFKGKPLQTHMPLPIGEAHFARWLQLFGETAAETCPPAAAEFFVDRAERIAESLKIGIKGPDAMTAALDEIDRKAGRGNGPRPGGNGQG